MQIHHVKHFLWVVQLYQPGDDHRLELQHTIMTGTNSEQEQFPNNFLYPGSCRTHRTLQFEAVAVTLPWCQARAVLMAPEQSFPCSRGRSTPGVLHGAGVLQHACWNTRYSYLQVTPKYSENRRRWK